MKNRYFENLDGLRFILAFVIFSGHSLLGHTFAAVCPFDFLKRLVSLFSNGGLAVSFFFTLSGYLITYLLLEENEVSGTLHLRDFYLRRVLRIWPLYYLVLLFSFFIYPWIKMQLGYVDQNPFRLAYQALFLSNFDSITVDESGLTGVAPMMISINWSIAIEEQFYLVWPLLFLVIGPKRFWMVSILVIATSFYCRYFVLSGPASYYHTFAVMSDLGMGALFGCLSFQFPSFAESFKKLDRYRIGAVYTCGVLLLLYPELLAYIHLDSRIVFTLYFAFIILEQNYSENSLFKIGHSSGLSRLGKYTYALYLLHPVGIQASILIFRFLRSDPDQNFLNGLLYAGISFVSTMALSYISYHYFEVLFLRLRKRLRHGTVGQPQ
jgi:peptidoglycan/LPS O-acetylase OafA/YrhL